MNYECSVNVVKQHFYTYTIIHVCTMWQGNVLWMYSFAVLITVFYDSLSCFMDEMQ